MKSLKHIGLFENSKGGLLCYFLLKHIILSPRLFPFIFLGLNGNPAGIFLLSISWATTTRSEELLLKKEEKSFIFYPVEIGSISLI